MSGCTACGRFTVPTTNKTTKPNQHIIKHYLTNKMPLLLDSLEMTVIIDNELDVMSPPPPTAVGSIISHGSLGNISRESAHVCRGNEEVRELKMESICCAAHGLSILLVLVLYTPYKTLRLTVDRQVLLEMKREAYCLILGQRKTHGNETRRDSV